MLKKILKVCGLIAAVIILAAAILLAYLLVGYKNTKVRNDQSAQVKKVAGTLAVPDVVSAISKVRNQSEVFKFELDLKKAGKKASFETQDDGDDWLIQVFEIVQNEGEASSHTATFGWYRVNKKTGEATREL